MKIIVAVDKNWGIGKNNDLLFCLKQDMQHFKECTLNKVVVMGGNTLKSLPNSQPLKNRTNVVLSATASGDFIAAKNLEQLFEILRQYNTDDVFVIGGASVYGQLLPFCSTAIITKVEADGGATAFFPNLDESDEWEQAEKSQPINDNGFIISFCTYKRKEKK